MAIYKDDVKELAKLGASVGVDAGYYDLATAKQVAAIVKSTGAQLVIENAGRYSSDDLKELVKLAGGRILLLGLSK